MVFQQETTSEDSNGKFPDNHEKLAASGGENGSQNTENHVWYYLCTLVKETLIPGIQSVCRIYQNLIFNNLRFKNHVDFCLYCCTPSVLPAVPFIPCESCLLSVASVSVLEALEAGTETVGLDREIKHLNSSSRTIGSLASRSEGRFPAKTKFRLKPSFGKEFVGLCRLDESLAEKAQEQGDHEPERCQLWRKQQLYTDKSLNSGLLSSCNNSNREYMLSVLSVNPTVI